MITCELGITSYPYIDTTIVTYEIELPTDGKTVALNLLDDADFTIPYVIDKIQNSPAGNQILTQAKKMYGSLLSMEKSSSHLKVRLINYSTIRLDVENSNPISVYA